MGDETRDNKDNPGVIAPPPLIYVGISARANAFPPVLLLPAIFTIMRRGVIEREERYLERKFGDGFVSARDHEPVGMRTHVVDGVVRLLR